jgi:hypothetical protein
LPRGGYASFIAIGIAVVTVVLMYGWMGYTLYSGYLEDQVSGSTAASPYHSRQNKQFFVAVLRSSVATPKLPWLSIPGQK